MSTSIPARKRALRLLVLLSFSLVAGVLCDWLRSERVLFHPRPPEFVAEPN